MGDAWDMHELNLNVQKLPTGNCKKQKQKVRACRPTAAKEIGEIEWLLMARRRRW